MQGCLEMGNRLCACFGTAAVSKGEVEKSARTSEDGRRAMTEDESQGSESECTKPETKHGGVFKGAKNMMSTWTQQKSEVGDCKGCGGCDKDAGNKH